MVLKLCDLKWGSSCTLGCANTVINYPCSNTLQLGPPFNILPSLGSPIPTHHLMTCRSCPNPSHDHLTPNPCQSSERKTSSIATLDRHTHMFFLQPHPTLASQMPQLDLRLPRVLLPSRWKVRHSVSNDTRELENSASIVSIIQTPECKVTFRHELEKVRKGLVVDVLVANLATWCVFSLFLTLVQPGE